MNQSKMLSLFFVEYNGDNLTTKTHEYIASKLLHQSHDMLKCLLNRNIPIDSRRLFERLLTLMKTIPD